LFETPAFYWQESSFQFNDKSFLPARLLELPSSGIQSADAKNMLSGISLITEINLV
jgi:hypothetical protein